MSLTQSQVIDELRRVKGPDLEGNIIDLGLVSEILIRDSRVYFSITIPPDRAEELEPLRKAAHQVVSEIDGVAGVTAVLTAEAAPGASKRAPASPPKQAPASEKESCGPGCGCSSGASANGNAKGSAPESARVQEARARGASGDGGRAAAPQLAQAGGRPQATGIPGVRHIVAIASGKGGVGKSTTAVNLALGFQAIGLKAGILDADIYGPSQPRLLGLAGNPGVAPGGNKLLPMIGYGLPSMSMGYMIDEATPIIWRGPMIVQALNQMLREVAWGELDVLVIDMPPGTGDVQLTMAQQVPLAGAVIVSTPQDLALIDARKGLNMFRKVDVPLLGIIENMSYFVCPSCGTRSDIFGHGGAEDEARKLGVPFLGGIPLHIDIRAKSDSGQPITATAPESVHAGIYRELAAKVWAEIEASQGRAVAPPQLALNADASSLNVAFPDGESYDLSAEMLRVMSPSAEVQGHSPSEKQTVGGKRNVKITSLDAVGNYAVKIVFSDGHSTGLFTWPYLATLGREKDSRWEDYLAELTVKGLSRG